MRLVVLMIGAIAAAATSIAAGPNDPSPRVANVLNSIRLADKEQLAVSEEDGQFLRVLIAATRARRVLEIGAASGYSAIWMGLGVRETAGQVYTIEYDRARATAAAANVKRAGLQDVVHVIAGDAFTEIPKLGGTFDIVFLDAWKPDYRRFFDLVFPRVNAGGMFLAHNVINKKHEMPDFLSIIHNHPAALTTIVSPGHEGISITYKKR